MLNKKSAEEPGSLTRRGMGSDEENLLSVQLLGIISDNGGNSSEKGRIRPSPGDGI
jgi:hypothetical protein